MKIKGVPVPRRLAVLLACACLSACGADEPDPQAAADSAAAAVAARRAKGEEAIRARRAELAKERGQREAQGSLNEQVRAANERSGNEARDIMRRDYHQCVEQRASDPSRDCSRLEARAYPERYRGRPQPRDSGGFNGMRIP